MIPVFFLLFSVITEFVNYEEPTPEIQIQSSPPILKKQLVTFLFAMGIICMIYFAFSTIMSISSCLPEDSDAPGIGYYVFHIICGILLLVTSILFYVGISKVKVNDSFYYNGYSQSNQKITELINLIENPFQQKVKQAANLYTNIIEHDKYSKSLQEIAINYNSTFSNNNDDYRIHFNNIYYKSDTCNYLKYLLKCMDESRNTILNEIMKILAKYDNMSNSIKNTLRSYHSDYIKNAEKEHKNLNKKLNKIANDINNRKPLGSKTYKGAINVVFANVVSTGILAFVVVYSIVFYFQNACSRCCFCSYSIWALLILLGAFLCGFLTFEKKYTELTNTCSQYQNIYSFSENNHIKTEIEKALFEYKERRKNIKKDLNLNDFNFDKKSFELIYNMINSKSVHSNYETVYFQYATNDKYKSDINSMISIIKKNDKTLKKISNLYKNITEFITSFHHNLRIIQYSNYSQIDNQYENDLINGGIIKLDSTPTCNKLITGFNVLIIADLFMIVGLILMSISVFLRRPHLNNYDGVSNNGISTNKDDDDDEDDDDGMKYYELGEIVTGFVTTSDESGEPDFNEMSRDGRWGDGYYTSKTTIAAFLQYIRYNDGKRVDINNFYFCGLSSDFGRVLEVPASAYSKFKCPASLQKHDCTSLIGHNPDGTVDYVLYFKEDIKSIYKPIHLTPQEVLGFLDAINNNTTSNENQQSKNDGFF